MILRVWFFAALWDLASSAASFTGGLTVLIRQVIGAELRAARTSCRIAGLADPDVADMGIGLHAATYALAIHFSLGAAAP
jgi:hypothetical protein